MFSRREYWSRKPFPSPGDLSNPGIRPWPCILQAGSLSSETPRKPLHEKRWAHVFLLCHLFQSQGAALVGMLSLSSVHAGRYPLIRGVRVQRSLCTHEGAVFDTCSWVSWGWQLSAHSWDSRGRSWHCSGSSVGRCCPYSQESGGSAWHLLLGLGVAVHSHLWGLGWPQWLAPAPRTPVGSVLLPNGHRERSSYGALSPLPMHPLNNGTWYLSSAPASSEYLVCCYRVASSGCLHAANPGPLPGSDLWSLYFSA